MLAWGRVAYCDYIERQRIERLWRTIPHDGSWSVLIRHEPNGIDDKPALGTPPHVPIHDPRLAVVDGRGGSMGMRVERLARMVTGNRTPKRWRFTASNP
jgi:hypothetical protein